MSCSLRRWLRRPPSTSPRANRKVLLGFRPTLDALESREVPAVITVTTTADDLTPNDGTVSLREAITAINAGNNLGDPDIISQTPGTFGTNDTINFNIPGSGVHTINVGTDASALNQALPTITKSVFIDGYSQPGSSTNTLTSDDNATLLIEVNAKSGGPSAALAINSGGSAVQGLIIDQGQNEGILLTSGGGNVIRGNFIGTDPTGTSARGNGLSGISILSSFNTIGGTVPADRNLISGNKSAGVTLLNSGITGNLIEGDFIGTDATGAAPLGNGAAGVRINNGTGNTVGGAGPGAGNVIAYNAGDGVQFDFGDPLGNAVLSNSIFANGKLGIYRTGTLAPVLTAAVTDATGTTVTGTLQSTPNTVFRLEFFGNDALDPSGAGEGKRYLGFTSVTTDGAGNATFTFQPATPVPVGQFVTATATDFAHNTSEFSAAVVVTSPPIPSSPAPPVVPPVHLLAVGAGDGTTLVNVYNADGSFRFSILAFPGFNGGVRVATGDVTGDKVDDIIVGVGPGAPGGHVKVFDGVTGALVRSFFAFDLGYTGEVNVGAGDVNGDGVADIIVGAGPGAPGGHVKVFDGVTGAEIRSFFAFDPGFTGGVTVAAADINGDGFAEIIVGTETGSSHVKAFDGATGALVRSFFAFDPGFLGGVTVAGGDINGDGLADLCVGAASGDNSHVKVFDGATGAVIRSFFALPSGSSAGIRVAVGNLNGDGPADLIVGSGSDSHVLVFRSTDLAPLEDFFAFDTSSADCVFVG